MYLVTLFPGIQSKVKQMIASHDTWCSTCLHLSQWKIMAGVVVTALVSGVSSVEWTYAPIYHYSLSACVGGPGLSIIAIWGAIDSNPGSLLCSKPLISQQASKHVFTRTALGVGTQSSGLSDHIVYHYQLCALPFHGGLRGHM